MELSINSQQFKKLFLEQISKISDSAVVVLNEKKISCLTCTPDNSVILSIDFPVEAVTSSLPVTLNIGDIKKLIRAIDCIDKEKVTLQLHNNNLTYKDNNIQFKYHLLENGIIPQPKINVDKLNKLEFDSTFTLTDRTLNDVIKASTFSTDSNKIYLTSEDNVIKGNLTDKTRFNIDCFETIVSDKFEGTKIQDLCLNFEVFRILSTGKFNELKCQISSKLGVVLFSFQNNILTTKFIVSALTK